MNGEMGNALVDAGRPARALAYLQNAMELDSTYWTVHANMGAYYTATAQPDEAVRAHRRAVALAGNVISARVGLARALAHAGKRDEARRILSELQTEAAATNVFHPAVAPLLHALGDVDGSMAWLEQSYRQRHPELALLEVDSSFAEEPRFIDLMRRIRRAP
jgi:Flp pilus assembly protein TadD